MGTFGVGPFENDDALDWVDDFCTEPDFKAVAQSLSELARRAKESGNSDVTSEDFDPDLDYLEFTEGAEALAMAELVAALLGKPCKDFPEDLAAWVEAEGQPPKAGLVAATRSAVQWVLSAGECHDLWLEEGEEDYQGWKDRGADLLKRLSENTK